MASPDADIRILLAAPSPRVRAAVKRVFIEAGHRVVTVADGDAGAEAAVQDPPDLLISVLDLPHVRGPELAQVARGARRTHPLPCLWLMPASDAREAPSGPLDAVLRLPFTAKALLGTATRLIDAAKAGAPPPAEVVVAPPRPAWSRRLAGEVSDEPPPEVPTPVEDVDLDAVDEPSPDDEAELTEIPAEKIDLDDEASRVMASGRLSETGLGKLLVGAMESAFTGLLVLEHEEVEKRIHLRHGRPVYCESNLLVETLGEYLVHQGLISPDDIPRAARMMIEEGIHQGQALVALGAITREQLADAMHFHVREKVVNCYAWPDANYRLEAIPTEAQRVLAVEMEPLLLVADGVRRFTAPQTFFHFLDEHMDEFAVPGPAFARHVGALNALSGGRPLARALDGQATVSAVLEASGLDSLLFAQLLLALTDCGLVTLLAEPASTQLPMSAREDTLIAEMKTLSTALAAAGEPVELTTAQEAVRDEVLQHYISLPHVDPYSLLGVAPDAAPADVAQAFAAKVAVVGPDRLAGFPDAEVARMGREVYLRLIEAYETLRDPERRETNRGTLDEREARKQLREMNLEADLHYRTGLNLLSANEPADAETEFREAGKLNRREPAYALYAGWAGYLAGKAKDDQAARARGETQIRRALEALPILEDGYLFLAEIARDRGDVRAAKNLLDRALVFNPGSADARALLSSL